LGGKLIIEVPNFDFSHYGQSCLNTIGAVHPLGFDSEFFIHNLPNYGFKIEGFYNSWQDFPDNPSMRSESDIVLLIAEKIADES
jgi:hypothetical protein